MIKGIGTDMVRISEIARFLEDEKISDSYTRATFTKAENAAAETRNDKAAYYASRFAAKEAFYKAASLFPSYRELDLTKVECLNDEYGRPYITSSSIQDIAATEDIKTVHVSITDEDDYVLAFVIIE